MADLLNISRVLTVDYVSQKLSQWFNKDVVYSKHEYGAGTGKGDCYLSDVYRVTFSGKVKNPVAGEPEDVSVRLIIKGLPSNIGTRRTFRSEGFFNNEINFYEQIVPAFLKFQSEKKMTEPFVSLPKVFASLTNGVDDFLALEDLTVYGYGNAVRQEGIDILHCQKILETFAKFHALSFAFKDQHPEEYRKLTLGVPERYYSPQYWDWYKGFWKAICEVAIDALEKEYPNTIYSEKIKKFATPETFLKVAKAAEGNFDTDVIGHGDSWTPNFLFKYKPGTIEPTDSMMLDFQLARSASPILDVAFFIYAVSSKELRDEHYTNMLKYYYDILSKQIKELGTDPEKVYSWDVFMQEVKKYSYFGVAFSMESTPVIILPPEEAFDVNGVVGDEAVDISTIWSLKPIKSQSGRQRLAGIIIHAVDNGYI